MNVVLAVARDARFWRCYTLTGARLVARMACDRAMRAGQFKFGIGRMIKDPTIPAIGRMTSRTCAAHSPFMMLIGVTSFAILRRFTIRL